MAKNRIKGKISLERETYFASTWPHVWIRSQHSSNELIFITKLLFEALQFNSQTAKKVVYTVNVNFSVYDIYI